jgi:hypothetical protein
VSRLTLTGQSPAGAGELVVGKKNPPSVTGVVYVENIDQKKKSLFFSDQIDNHVQESSIQKTGQMKRIK